MPLKLKRGLVGLRVDSLEEFARRGVALRSELTDGAAMRSLGLYEGDGIAGALRWLPGTGT